MGPICIGDNLEIAINFYSPRGIIDASSINWCPITLSNSPNESVLNYRREKHVFWLKDKSTKLVADLSRICELEDSQQEWRYESYYPLPPKTFNFLTRVEELFDVKAVEYSNVDILAMKFHLLAKKVGDLKTKMLGVGIRIMEGECTNEVKKAGLAIERQCGLELRIGDLLIFYLAKPSGRY